MRGCGGVIGFGQCEEKKSVMLLFLFISDVRSLEHDVRVNRKCTKYNNRNIYNK